MARHKSDKQTARLLAEMDETRNDLNEVIGGLLLGDTTKAEIARAASWNAGYLGDFLDNPTKRPTTRKVETLIAALVPFVEASPDEELASALDRLGSRYGIEISSLANPTAGPISASAPNWVKRTDIERGLNSCCEANGDYAIEGPPMTGISSALLYVESRLKKSHFVRHLNAGSELVESAYGRESKTGIMGLVAAALTKSTEPLELEFYEVQDRIRDYLTDLEQPFALLVDDVNKLARPEVESLKLVLRDWATRRAVAEDPFTEVSTWMATTSDVRNARYQSNFYATYVVLRWFAREEVRGELSQSLAPYSVAREVVGSAKWHTDAAKSAWSLFAGQPHLTHLFLWDRHLDGKTKDDEILEKAPTGAYKRHVDTLARSLVNLVGQSGALALVQFLGSTTGAPTQANLASAESLGIIDPSQAWSCSYYRAHLPRAVAVMADNATGAGID